MVHKISMRINNNTPFNLVPNGQYAFWGETNSGPQLVAPNSDGDAGVFQASAVPWVGSAGISCYTITTPIIGIALLGSDPDWSTESNRARVKIAGTNIDPNKNTYNDMFDGQTYVSYVTTKGIFTLTGTIGSNDDCTATYVLTFIRGNGVTDENLASPEGW